MLRGICPRGRRSAPGRGKTGMTDGQSSGPRYTAFIPIPISPNLGASGEQERGEPPPPCQRHLVHRAPGLEELNELLARAVLVPIAVAPDDFKEVVDSFSAPPAGVQPNGEIEAGLMIHGIALDLALQVREVAKRARLLGEFDGRAGAG